jgi:hypothetical protein
MKLFQKPPETFYASYVTTRNPQFKIHKQHSHAMLAMDQREDWYKAYLHAARDGEAVYEWKDNRWNLEFFHGGEDFSVPFDLGNGTTLTNVHPYRFCEREVCVIHNPSRHHMITWPLNWRNDRGIFERICVCGVGHCDPDQFDYWRRTNQIWQTVHGCCGHCKE